MSNREIGRSRYKNTPPTKATTSSTEPRSRRRPTMPQDLTGGSGLGLGRGIQAFHIQQRWHLQLRRTSRERSPRPGAARR